MNEHHRKTIRYSLSHMKFIEEQIAEIDQDIAAKIQEAGLDQQWQILQTVPGVQQRSAAKILAETGADMTQFPSQPDLSSWAGICPETTGALGRIEATARQEVIAGLKEKFWRITTKSRGKKNSALLAVAHTILQLVYEVLRTGQPYRDWQAPALSGQQKDRLIRHHVRGLGKLGVRVHSLGAGAGSQKPPSASRRNRERHWRYFRKNPLKNTKPPAAPRPSEGVANPSIERVAICGYAELQRPMIGAEVCQSSGAATVIHDKVYDLGYANIVLRVASICFDPMISVG
jgi:hypothetical protein